MRMARAMSLGVDKIRIKLEGIRLGYIMPLAWSYEHIERTYSIGEQVKDYLIPCFTWYWLIVCEYLQELEMDIRCVVFIVDTPGYES
jgi:hypothetical protein